MTKENREMAKGRDNAQVMGRGTPGETEGGRRPTGVSPGETVVGPLGQGHRERIIMATGLSVEIFFLLILIF